MRFFDPSTQRSVGKTEEICIIPVIAITQDEEARTIIHKHLANLFQQGKLSEFRQASVMRAVEQGDLRLLPGNIYARATNLEDWIPDDCQWFLPSKADLKEYLAEAESGWKDALEEDRKDAGFDQADHLSFRNAGDSMSMLLKRRHCFVEPLRMGIEIMALICLKKHISVLKNCFREKKFPNGHGSSCCLDCVIM